VRREGGSERTGAENNRRGSGRRPQQQANSQCQELISGGISSPNERVARHGDQVGNLGEGDGNVGHQLTTNLNRHARLRVFCLLIVAIRAKQRKQHHEQDELDREGADGIVRIFTEGIDAGKPRLMFGYLKEGAEGSAREGEAESVPAKSVWHRQFRADFCLILLRFAGFPMRRGVSRAHGEWRSVPGHVTLRADT
jgi:hypothetical protein